MKDIYLSIANYTVKIVFHKTDLAILENLLIGEISSVYKCFISTIKSPIRPDYVIDVVENKNTMVLYHKKEKSTFLLISKKKSPKSLITFYYIGIAQFQTIIQMIMIELLQSDRGFLVHASAVEINNKAYVFMAPSGGGKSTIAAMFGRKYPILADDGVIIRKEKDEYYLYQTPLFEKFSTIVKSNKKYHLGKLFFIRKSDYYKVVRLQNINKITSLLSSQVFISTEQISNQLADLSDFILGCHSWYVLYFSKNIRKFKNYQQVLV